MKYGCSFIWRMLPVTVVHMLSQAMNSTDVWPLTWRGGQGTMAGAHWVLPEGDGGPLDKEERLVNAPTNDAAQNTNG